MRKAHDTVQLEMFLSRCCQHTQDGHGPVNVTRDAILL